MKNTKIWDEWEKCKAYSASMGFNDDFPEITKFKEGDQWPRITERTKHLPRPIFNITEMFISRKRASVTNQTMSINYKASEVNLMNDSEKEFATEGARLITGYTKQLLEDMDFDDLASDFIDDAATYGTGILHFFWDNSVSGGELSRYIGDVRGETVDPLDIGFARPKLQDVQKQPYIIIRSRETVENVRAFAKNIGLSEEEVNRITADQDESENALGGKQVSDDKDCTVLTKYYRKNGEVCYDRATKSVVLVSERFLTPSSNDEDDSITKAPADIEDESLSDEVSGPDIPRQNDNEEEYKISLYPIEIISWKKRKKSIFGVGEAKDIITINRAYNFLKAMQILSVQDTGWPKTVVKKGMLEGNITNAPGEVLVERETGAIRHLAPPSPTGAASAIAEEIFSMARTLSGVTDVSTGENIGSNIAAAAIIALQNQARTPIREIQRRYKGSIRRIARILLEFYKTYFSVSRNLIMSNALGEDEEVEFKGTDYAAFDFKVSIDVGEATEYADELTMTTLDKFYDRKEITLEQYMELAPANVVPFKEKLKSMLSAETVEAVPEEDEDGDVQMQEVNLGAV